MKKNNVLNLLHCKCGRGFIFDEKNNIWQCENCKIFEKQEKKFTDMAEGETPSAKQKNLVFLLKSFFRKFPKIYFFLAFLFGGRQVNTTAKKFVKSLGENLAIINLGSGTKVLRDDVINVDFFPFPGVQVVAKAEDLPFADDSIDVVVCDNLLEHTKEPDMVVKEILRILKPGGKIYMGVPFIINYHSSPNDFYRWTAEGVRQLMSDFKQLELKIACGPTSAMTAIFAEWLAIALSFNLFFLYNIFISIFTVVLAPIKLLDYIISFYHKAENIAYGFYFIGKK